MEKFKVGDLVGLKSDGPVMTIKALPSPGLRAGYLCQWFAGKKLEQGDFPEASLERRTAKKSSDPA